MATFTRLVNEKTQSFYYRRCKVSVSEKYLGNEYLGHPSVFVVMINELHVATQVNSMQLRRNSGLREYVRDGNTIYYYELQNTHLEFLNNLPLFPIRTLEWAIKKAKEIVDEKYS